MSFDTTLRAKLIDHRPMGHSDPRQPVMFALPQMELRGNITVHSWLSQPSCLVIAGLELEPVDLVVSAVTVYHDENLVTSTQLCPECRPPMASTPFRSFTEPPPRPATWLQRGGCARLFFNRPFVPLTELDALVVGLHLS